MYLLAFFSIIHYSIKMTPGQTFRRAPNANGFSCTKTRYFKTLAIPVTSIGQTVFTLPNDDTLKNSKILAIEALTLDDVLIGPQGQPIVNQNVMLKSYLTVKAANTNEEVITKIALPRLRAYNNSGSPFHVCIEQINPADCYIEVGNTANLVVGEVFLITFHFERKN